MEKEIIKYVGGYNDPDSGTQLIFRLYDSLEKLIKGFKEDYGWMNNTPKIMRLRLKEVNERNLDEFKEYIVTRKGLDEFSSPSKWEIKKLGLESFKDCHVYGVMDKNEIEESKILEEIINIHALAGK